MKATLAQEQEEVVKPLLEPPQQPNQEFVQFLVAEEIRRVEELHQQVLTLVEQQRQQQQKALKDLLAQRIEQLDILADDINALATQLETEILKFLAVALEINPLYQAIQQPPQLKTSTVEESKLLNIWEINSSTIPTVSKQGVRFVLTAKTLTI